MSVYRSFFQIPSPFQTEEGILNLLEPQDSSVRVLRDSLLSERYSKPFVLEDRELRYLYFNIRLMQSAMRLKSPDDLILRYTQKMMAFLLFQSRPKRLVLLGLGGGSLVKFCYRRLPGTHITAVELSPHVLAFRELFLVPPDDERLCILEEDGAEYISRVERGIDVLLVDTFDKEGFAPELASEAFFRQAWEKLSGNGILVVNLAGEPATYAGLVGEVMGVFEDQVIVVSVPEDGNHILYAFRNRHFDPRWRVVHNLAKEMKARYGLDFPRFSEKLERAAKQGIARHLLEGNRY